MKYELLHQLCDPEHKVCRAYLMIEWLRRRDHPPPALWRLADDPAILQAEYPEGA